VINQKSIAVLPFQNISSDKDNEYLADGITEEIINALSKVDGLKVSARTSSFSYKDTKTDARIIGNELGVSTVLDGSIRRVGSRVRISAQLIRTDNGFNIWAENFDRQMKDIFLLQDEISILIAEKIRENYGHLEIARHLLKSPTDDIEAYELYLKGRYNHLKWNWEGLQNGIKYYEESLARDSTFALPYYGLAFCYTMVGSWAKRPELLDLALDYVEKGFALKNKSDLGYFAKASHAFWGQWDFINGEKAYKKAIALNPTNSEAMEGLAELYIAIGYFDEAERLTTEALKANPISANHLFTMGNIYYQQGQTEKGLSYFNSGLRVDPKFEHCIVYKSLALIELGQLGKLQLHVEAYPDRNDGALCFLLFKVRHAEIIDKALANEVAQMIEITDDQGFIGWKLYLLAQIGEKEKALDILETVIAGKEGQYVNFTNLPLLAPIRNEPRFKKLIDSTFAKGKIPKKHSGSKRAISSKKSLMEASEIERLGVDLKRLMNEELAFLNPTISLREIANELRINPNRLSWFLNDQLGKNFNEFVNEKRLESFKERAQSEDWSHLTILGLAYECGFNSKSVFNEYFKKSLGQTPSQWVKANRNKA
jgi:TolB-like protein/AraC-like DNA-binding protein